MPIRQLRDDPGSMIWLSRVVPGTYLQSIYAISSDEWGLSIIFFFLFDHFANILGSQDTKEKNCAGWNASSDPFKDISFIANNAPVNPHSQPFPTPGHAENPLLVGRTNLRLRRTQGSLYRLWHQYACFLKESFYLNSWNLSDMREQRYGPYCH